MDSVSAVAATSQRRRRAGAAKGEAPIASGGKFERCTEITVALLEEAGALEEETGERVEKAGALGEGGSPWAKEAGTLGERGGSVPEPMVRIAARRIHSEFSATPSARGDAKGSSAIPSSATVANRWAGSFCKQRATTSANPEGTSGWRESSRRGSVSRTAAQVSAMLSAWNAGFEAMSS
jgi:hypothetical protein